MLKQQARALALGVFILDILLVTAAFLGAYWLRDSLLPGLMPNSFSGPLYPFASYLPLLPLAATLWGIMLVWTGRYRSHRTSTLVQEARGVLQAAAGAAVLFALAIFALRLDVVLLGEDRISRSWVFLFVGLAALFLIVEKLTLRVVSRYVRNQGYNYRTVLIVGTERAALRMAQSLEDHAHWGFKIVGFVRGDGEEAADPLMEDSLLGHPVLGGVADIPRIVDQQVVDDVFFALPRRDLDRLEDVFLGLHQLGIRTRFALDILPHGSAQMQVEELDGLPMLAISPTPDSLPLFLLKRVMDVGLSLLLLIVGLPIIFLVAVALKITTGGTVLYRQTRCGLNGRRFTLYKFRTMVEDAERIRDEIAHLNEMTGPVFKVREDPRVTPLGKVLRRFSLDELPQLWNVLRGDMSLVGPRPPIPEEVEAYARWQRRRLSMKPGLTCLWQISGRNEVDFDRWIELDLEYIDSWSPSLDFKILLKTIPVVLSGRGAS